jgi:antitoxin HicB
MERVEGYTEVYRQAEDVILAEVPAIPGCFSDGRTLEEARERVRDAILNFLEDLKESGENIAPSKTPGHRGRRPGFRAIAWARTSREPDRRRRPCR